MDCDALPVLLAPGTALLGQAHDALARGERLKTRRTHLHRLLECIVHLVPGGETLGETERQRRFTLHREVPAHIDHDLVALDPVDARLVFTPGAVEQYDPVTAAQSQHLGGVVRCRRTQVHLHRIGERKWTVEAWIGHGPSVIGVACYDTQTAPDAPQHYALPEAALPRRRFFRP